MDGSRLGEFYAWLKDRPVLAGIPIDIGPMSDTTEKRIAIMDYPGPTGPNWQGNYRVQIRMRGRATTSGVVPYKDVHDLADAVVSVVAPAGDARPVIDLSRKRAVISLVSGPLSLGLDGKGRWEMSLNVALETSRV